MKKASLKKLFVLLSASAIASVGVLWLTQSKQTNNNATNYSDSNNWSTQSFDSSTTQRLATAYFNKTYFSGGKSFNYVDVTLPIEQNELRDLNQGYIFISFTFSHPNAAQDNVMYLGYKDKVEEVTESILPTQISIENGKYNDQNKTYTLTVKFSGLYAWDLSNFKFQLGLDGREIQVKPTKKPSPQTQTRSSRSKRSVVGEDRSAVVPAQKSKGKKRVRRGAPKPAPVITKDLDSMSDNEVLRLAQSVEQYHAPARPKVSLPTAAPAKPQWKSSLSDFKFTPVYQTRSAEFRTTNHYKPNRYVTFGATNEYLDVLDHSQWTGFVPNLRLYQVTIPNEFRFSENPERRFYLNMNVQEDNKTSSASYIVDGKSATLITNYSNKSDISMYTDTYKADDEKGFISFQILLGNRFDPSKTRLTMSFTGFRDGTYFRVSGRDAKVQTLTKWQQNEVWSRGTWNQHVTIKNNSNNNLEGKEVIVKLQHIDTPDVTLKYKVKDGKLLPEGSVDNLVKFGIHNNNKPIIVKQGKDFGFYVQLSSLFDPTKAVITVTYNGKQQVVNMPNFWKMFDKRY